MRPARDVVSTLLAFTAATCASQLSAQARLPPPVELRVPKPPTVATAETGSFLVYELHITNFSTQVMTLKQVDVTTTGADRRVLFALADSALVRSIARPGSTPAQLPASQRTKLDGGLRAVVFLWMPLQRTALPQAIRHRVTLETGGADSVRVEQLEGPEVPVHAAPPHIAPPLRGGPWLTANGPAPETGHRRALIPVGGVPAIAQRFAIDYVKVGDDFRTFTGDRLKNENYHAYGADASAVADGVVVATKDSIPENVPGITSRAVPITLETVGGNYVIIDIGGGRYAFYAHLQPGSLRVRTGERVRRGQVLGLVGNSGNSTEPHLHFHVADGISPLGSEGIPYGHDFQIVARCRTFNVGCENVTPAAHTGELPLGNIIIRFPD